jgi:hypothetical protein
MFKNVNRKTNIQRDHLPIESSLAETCHACAKLQKKYYVFPTTEAGKLEAYFIQDRSLILDKFVRTASSASV